MKIAFIGGGNMATALIGGLLKKDWPAADIAVVEISAEARDRLARELRVSAHAELAPALKDAGCVVFAVKPQQLKSVAAAAAPMLGGALVISIAAGVRLETLSAWLGGYRRIVRAMPNTPALVLAGVTGLYAPADLSSTDRAQAVNILGVAGATLWVDSETRMDAITAVSGSGPAYVFYFMEALQAAAVKLGFSEEDARFLANETFSGSVQLASQSEDPVAVLRAKVTSKGGTTERAIATMEAHAVKAHIGLGVEGAAIRSRELGDELGNS